MKCQKSSEKFIIEIVPHIATSVLLLTLLSKVAKCSFKIMFLID
jgi:hypothetical protein